MRRTRITESFCEMVEGGARASLETAALAETGRYAYIALNAANVRRSPSRTLTVGL